MIFNDIDFSDKFRVLAINKPFMPSILDKAQAIDGMDGLYPAKQSTFKEILIDVTIEMKNNGAQSQDDYLRSIAGQLFTKKEAKLIFKREPNRYYNAKLVGDVGLKRFYCYGIAELTFQATTPFILGLTDKTVALNTQFTNAGTYESYGVISVTAPTANNVTVSNGDKTLKLLFPFTGTQEIVIDLEKQYVTMNGANAMQYLTLDSDFFTIKSGSTKITSNGTGTVKYQERWL